jgi:hypothetical protein
LPLYEVEKVVSRDLGVENQFNFSFLVILQDDRRQRRNDVTRNGGILIWFKQRNVKNVVDL